MCSDYYYYYLLLDFIITNLLLAFIIIKFNYKVINFVASLHNLNVMSQKFYLYINLHLYKIVESS